MQSSVKTVRKELIKIVIEMVVHVEMMLYILQKKTQKYVNLSRLSFLLCISEK